MLIGKGRYFLHSEEVINNVYKSVVGYKVGGRKMQFSERHLQTFDSRNCGCSEYCFYPL